MNVIFIILASLVLCFGLVVLVGAPYLPTLRPQINAAFDLLDLPRGAHILELGAGDGRVALEALKRGYTVTAIELNPLLCIVMFFTTLRYRKNIRILCGNFWLMEWPKVDGIFVFLLEKYMPKLDAKIAQRYSRVKLASFAFKVPGKEIKATKSGVFLYNYNKSKN